MAAKRDGSARPTPVVGVQWNQLAEAFAQGAAAADIGLVVAVDDGTGPRIAPVSAVRRSGARLRRLIEAAPEGIGVARERGFVFANPALLRLVGAPNLEALASRNLVDLIHPADQPRARAAWREAFASGRERG